MLNNRKLAWRRYRWLSNNKKPLSLKTIFSKERWRESLPPVVLGSLIRSVWVCKRRQHFMRNCFSQCPCRVNRSWALWAVRTSKPKLDYWIPIYRTPKAIQSMKRHKKTMGLLNFSRRGKLKVRQQLVYRIISKWYQGAMKSKSLNKRKLEQ